MNTVLCGFLFGFLIPFIVFVAIIATTPIWMGWIEKFWDFIDGTKK